MALYNGDKITRVKDLRREKREWIAETFSAQDLKKGGMEQKEIEKLHGEARYGKTRYNKDYIRLYLKGTYKPNNR